MEIGIVSCYMTCFIRIETKQKEVKGALHMSRVKRGIMILAVIVVSMLIVPMITIHTVKADAGMLVTLLLFFAVYPIVSVVVGVLAGKDIKFFWACPLVLAVLFWLFSCLTYETAFPIVYSAVYFVICVISMMITWLRARGLAKK